MSRLSDDDMKTSIYVSHFPHLAPFLTKSFNLVGEENQEMGPVTPLKLPIIDFSKEDLKPRTRNWEFVRAQVQQALEEYGCFEAVYNKVPLELHKAIFSALEELFNLPIETKILNTSDKPFYGYAGQSPLVPLYESLGIDDAPVLEGTQSFTNRMWSNGNASFWYDFISTS